MNNKLKLTDYDFENAKRVYEEGKIFPFTEENMFKSALYVILSAAENNLKQVKVYNELIGNKLDTPRKILANPSPLECIVGKARFHNNKIKYIFEVSKWWERNGNYLFQEIKKDISDGKTREFEIREEIATEIPGMSHKCSSLFLSKCGYENIVPVDLWMIRFLADTGLEIKLPDYKTNGGLSKKKYFEYEKIISDIARKEYGISPIILQCILWGRYSSWKNKKYENPNQLEIGF